MTAAPPVEPALLSPSSRHLDRLAGVSGPIGCSAFVAYAYLSSLDRLSPQAARAISADRAAVYYWYTSTCAAQHRPNRLPLSDADIAYLMETDPLSAMAYPVPRIVVWHAAAAGGPCPPAFPTDAASDRALALWWTLDRAPSLGWEDRLVPDRYVELIGEQKREPSAEELTAAPPTAPAILTYTADLEIVGPIHQRSGLGQAARLSIETCRRAGLKIIARDFSYGFPSAADSPGEPDDTGGRAGAALFHMNPDMLPTAFAFGGRDYPRRRAGYFFWELDAPASCDFLAFDLVDQIWTASSFVQSIYVPIFGGDVIRVGLALPPVPLLNRAESQAALRQRAGLPSGTFTYICVFDGMSYVERKSPWSAIAAFQAAFPGDDSVSLVLKTQNRPPVGESGQGAMWASIEHACATDRRIRLIDASLPYASVLQLIDGADAFVSLHRAEGWGLGVAEAMQLGVPAIVTAYSGTEDFCDETTAFPVAGTLRAVGPDDYVHVEPGRRWMDCDPAMAAAALRQVRNDKPSRDARIATARHRLAETMSFESVGRRYVDSLERLLRTI